MTIDEAIEFYKGYKNRSGGTVNYNEFDEQMVELLEELSKRRVEELFRKENEKAIRDKAIDDFVNRMLEEGIISLVQYVKIKEIAEQLKEKR